MGPEMGSQVPRCAELRQSHMVLSLTLACPLSFTVFKCSGGDCFKRKETKIFPPLYPAQLGFTTRAVRVPGSGVSLSVSVWSHHYNRLNLGDLHRLLRVFPFLPSLCLQERSCDGYGYGSGYGYGGLGTCPRCGSSSVWPCGQVAVVLLHLRACHLPPECTPRPQRRK